MTNCYQTIQPVVQKETIQPSVVHTTVPIHEVHENEAKHHATTALPAVSMAHIKKQGGSLTGREERYDGFEGEPRAVGGALGGSTSGVSGITTGSHSSTSGPHSSNLGNKADPRVDSDRDGSRGYGSSTSTGYGSGTTGSGYGSGGAGPHSSSTENKLDPRVDSDGSRGYGSGTTGTGTGATGTHKKPGLMDKLNPMKDSDRDGKKGFME